MACLPFALWHGARATTDGATTLSVVEGAREATRYLQDLTHGGHDGVLIGTGLLACALGGAAAGRVPTAGHER